MAWTAGGFLLLVLLLVALAVAALFLLDWNLLKPYVESAIGTALLRDVTIESLDVEPGSTSTIHLRGLQVANPDWAEDDRLASVEALHITLHSWPLLLGRVEIVDVRAEAPVLDLERDADGEESWDIGKAAELAGDVVAPETRDEFPSIGRLLIDGGKLRYRDATRGLALEGEITTATGDAEGDDRVELAVKGSLEQQPITIAFKGGSFRALQESEAPFPVDLQVRFAETELTVEGTMTDPVQMTGLDLDILIAGPSLAQLFPLLGIPAPDTPPYRLSGSLKRDGELWRIADLEGTVGDSDLAGDVTLDRTKEPPFLKANLVSKKLDFRDLRGLIGADTGKAEAASKDLQTQSAGSIFPQTDIAVERLRAMDMDVTFEGEKVIAEHLPIDHLSARLQLTDGRAVISPLTLAVAGGTVSGEVALNARDELPSADADITFEELDLKPFFKDTPFVQEMGGRFFGHLYLLGEGLNFDQMMASAGGDGWIGMRDGSISGLLVEAAGLDIGEALVLVIGEDARVPIRCGRVDLSAKAGTVHAERAIIDTSDSVLLAQGTVSLADETVALQVEARPKDFSLIDMAAPIELSGSFKDPSVSIGDLDPLPFLELGQATDLDCTRLLAGELSPAEIRKDD